MPGGVSFHERYLARAMGLWADPQRLCVVDAVPGLALRERAGPASTPERPRPPLRAARRPHHRRPRHPRHRRDGGRPHRVRQHAVLLPRHAEPDARLPRLSGSRRSSPSSPPRIAATSTASPCRTARRPTSRRRAAATSSTAGATGAPKAAASSTWRRNAIVTEKLSMPHSPRWHDGRLWVLELRHRPSRHRRPRDAAPSSRASSARASCAGSPSTTTTPSSACRCRATARSPASQLDDELKKRDADPWCGMQIVNLASGDIVEWIRLEGGVTRAVRRAGLARRALAGRHRLPQREIHKLITFEA